MLTAAFIGCNKNESIPTNIADDNSVEIHSREIIYKDNQTDIYINISGTDDFCYFAEIRAKSISGKFVIHLTLDSNLKIISALIPSYIGNRGRDVKNARFTGQFSGKDPNNNLIVGQDIHAITGATASAKTMSESIRNTIVILEKLK